MHERRVLDIPGWNGRALKTVRHVVEGADRIAIVFPGRGYGCDMPALYYTRAVLLNAGIEVFEIHYRYEEVFVGEHTDETLAELVLRLEADVKAAVPVALEGGSYGSAIYVAKSLGTRATVFALGEALLGELPTSLVVHTPLLLPGWDCLAGLRDFEGDALFTIGTEDPHYDADTVKRLEAGERVRFHVIEGADHGLEIAGEPVQTAEAMSGVTAAVQAFVAAL